LGPRRFLEEEDGAVTVLKLSNGVMFRVPVEVQGMQLQAVVDTAAQVTLVSEEFYKSLDPAPYCSVLFLIRNTIPYIILYPLFLLLYGLVRVPLIPIVFLPY
jgi:hypothetical protein